VIKTLALSELENIEIGAKLVFLIRNVKGGTTVSHFCIFPRRYTIKGHVAEVCSLKFKVGYRRDIEDKLPTTPSKRFYTGIQLTDN
jgi:hypothetical protein